MTRQLFIALLALTLGSAAISQALAEGQATVLNLSSTRIGELPEGFATTRTGKGPPAEWAVIEDSTASDGRVLAQTSSDRTDYRFPLAINERVSAANIEVTVRFKAVAGKVDRAAGIAVRLADPDHYYVVRANALEDNVNFYRVVKGVRSEIQGARAKVTSNAWHTLGIRAEGDKFTVSFDGSKLFTASDRTLTAAGKVALWTKADSVTHFDTITTRTLP
jgi:hypothetical protein